MTILLAVVAVPINTVWGVVAAIQLTRNEFWGKTFVMAMLDLPFSISPVVTGVALFSILHGMLLAKRASKSVLSELSLNVGCSLKVGYCSVLLQG